jgi:anti-anti-sigma factor
VILDLVGRAGRVGKASMAVDWSDEIAIANLADEPALSDELSAVIENVETLGDPPHVVLDFHEVSYINSSNIAQLLKARKVLDAKQRQLVLCSMNDDVFSVMVVSGLEKLFRFAPDTLTAIASVQIEDPSA